MNAVLSVMRSLPMIGKGRGPGGYGKEGRDIMYRPSRNRPRPALAPSAMLAVESCSDRSVNMGRGVRFISLRNSGPFYEDRYRAIYIHACWKLSGEWERFEDAKKARTSGALRKL